MACSAGHRDAHALGRLLDPRRSPVRPRNASHAGGLSSEVDGRVRPTCARGTVHRPAGRGSQHSMGQVAVPGRPSPGPRGRTPQLSRRTRTTPASEAAGWSERQRSSVRGPRVRSAAGPAAALLSPPSNADGPPPRQGHTTLPASRPEVSPAARAQPQQPPDWFQDAAHTIRQPPKRPPPHPHEKPRLGGMAGQEPGDEQDDRHPGVGRQGASAAAPPAGNPARPPVSTHRSTFPATLL